MRKLILAILALLLLAATTSAASEAPGPLRVTGLVKQPLRLSLQDLSRLPQVRLRHNGITQTGSFHGVFWLQGVPLRDLLELAQVGKESGGFHKSVDLALKVRTADGKQVVLSWGEAFHQNPAEAVLSVSARPVMPKKDCKVCHEPGEYEEYMSQLARKVGLPKLALTRDQFSDRSLEKVISIEVVGLEPGSWGPKQEKLYSHQLLISTGGKDSTIKSLPERNKITLIADQVGEGKGFHGRKIYSGIPLRDLLEQQGHKGDVNTVYLISAPDGYRSLASWGEIFLGPLGRRIILADTMNGKPIQNTGKFHLVFPDDKWADRWVKAPASIKAVSLAAKPTLQVIGVGCGDSSLLTLEALTSLNRADVLVVPKDIQKRFAPYLAGKPVLFDPLAFGKKPFNPEQAHKDEKARHMRREEQEQAAAMIKKNLDAGKSVAVIDWGDPMIYGSWRWLGDFFDKAQIKFTPGISAFAAGSAALARDITCKGLIAISDPFTALKNQDTLKDLAGKGATLVLFMGLPKFDKLMSAVKKAYPADTPVNIVYRAGMGNGEKVLRTNLSQVMGKAKAQKEGWLGVIFVGPCLR
jgi:precorrin-4 methylase/DMSO/TMAO reductase YedYZ molybdopterin-dependent catalytic subunit